MTIKRLLCTLMLHRLTYNVIDGKLDKAEADKLHIPINQRNYYFEVCYHCGFYKVIIL